MEKIKPIPSNWNNQEATDYDRKVQTLSSAVEASRIKEIDFLGKRYYTAEYLEKANQELAEILQKQTGESEESAQQRNGNLFMPSTTKKLFLDVAASPLNMMTTEWY